MVWSFLAPKWPIPVPFCGMYHQKSNFLPISDTLPKEAVEASWCHFFENWLKNLKCPNLLKPLDTIIQENYWSFYLSEPFKNGHFNVRHPLWIISTKNLSVCNCTYSILVTPERYCVETRLKAYGHILEIYDFTQNTSPIRYLIPTHRYI